MFPWIRDVKTIGIPNNHKMLHGKFTVVMCSHCPTSTPIIRPIKIGSIEFCGGVHTAQRQTLTPITIRFCVNFSLSVSFSVSGNVNLPLPSKNHRICERPFGISFNRNLFNQCLNGEKPSDFEGS